MNLCVESLECQKYLAYVEAVEGCQEKHSEAKVFASLSEAKDYYSGKKFENVWLVQNMAYDEMIGLNPDAKDYRIPLHWN